MKRSTLSLLVIVLVAFVVGAAIAYTAGSMAPSPASSSSPVNTTNNEVLSPLVLDATSMVFVHEGQAAETEFSNGALNIVVPVSDKSTIRFIPFTGELTAGGRLEASAGEQRAATLPRGLPVVVSFDRNDTPVSVFGYLAAPPSPSSGSILYKLTVIDAPGKSSTYSIGGNYDIPASIEHVRVVIAGQNLVSK